ncbi:phage tail protein [Novosphingobium bradum]|uniref:Phage tail protein n=1 Tax=Novosphingobium bradum TaxID=1737444 RepID=A0ABV7IWX4_9SPHN
MATLVFSALGTILGGPLGGAIGALVGRQVDSAIIGSPSREGPRLKELAASTSSYGAPLARHFGHMRVGGSIIWATDLVEHRNTQGGGKGRPSVTSYAYSASFAVALSSRPIAGIGRIWADGNLLRGAAGDMKTGGTLRFYNGHGDQEPDPLMAAAESPLPCPAYRGLAYVVFEDLQLADFGNRIPALTFEILADEGAVSVAQICDRAFDGLSSGVTLAGISGLSQEASLAETLGSLHPILPLFYEVAGDAVRVIGEEGAAPVALREPTAATKDDEFGARTGFAAKRANGRPQTPAALRYYDIDRDYQPGVQRATGPVQSGQLNAVEIPVALDAAHARNLIEAAARRLDWSRQSVLWRSSEIDPAHRPGALVTIPAMPGIWRVSAWEWRASGLELTLVRTPFAAPPAALSLSTDTGRAAAAIDRSIGTTWLTALELPWDGTGAGDVPLVRAAVSSASPGWTGAALYLDDGDGQLVPAGSSGRTRATAGTVVTAPATASPLLVDRTSGLVVELLGDDMALQDATMRQLAMGANRALVGQEIVQFGRATPLGSRRWKLEILLRGRGGTEAFMAHAAGERFVLLDDALVALDGTLVAQSPLTTAKAIGGGDGAPVASDIACRGLTQRPLFPVHPRAVWLSDGSLQLGWTRRARAGWLWRDQVDTPLNEQAELYEVLLGSEADIIAMWETTQPQLTISAAVIAGLAAAHPGKPLIVRQRGSYASSASLHLTSLI